MSPNGPEDAAIVLKLLGSMTLLRGGKSSALPKSKKTRALLAYLALSTRPCRRDALCAMFWDRPDDPKGALRWSLSKLRPPLATEGGNALKSDGDLVQIDRGALAIDALDIQEALKDPEGCQSDRLEALAGAGDLLEGFRLQTAPISISGWPNSARICAAPGSPRCGCCWSGTSRTRRRRWNSHGYWRRSRPGTPMRALVS